MSTPDVVAFDFGGVLIEWDPRHLYRKLFAGDEAGMERFLTYVCSFTWNSMQDAGRSFDDAVAELTRRFPQHADLIAAYHERWEEMQEDSRIGFHQAHLARNYDAVQQIKERMAFARDCKFLGRKIGDSIHRNAVRLEFL